jgi:hypothetical protein
VLLAPKLRKPHIFSLKGQLLYVGPAVKYFELDSLFCPQRKSFEIEKTHMIFIKPDHTERFQFLFAFLTSQHFSHCGAFSQFDFACS